MGLGRALFFGFVAMFPGAILALFGWLIIGSPDTWESSQYLVCYGPFFGSIFVGFWLGNKDQTDVELE